MKSYLILLSLGLLMVSGGCALTRNCGHKLHCSSCGKTCHAEVKETESTHQCYSEECKDVCIPAIRYPWEDCCTPLRCGKVRSVKVLKKYEYHCPDCEVEWSVKDNGCGINGCGPTGHCHGSHAPWCGDDTGGYYAPTKPEPPSGSEQGFSKPTLPPPPMPLQPVSYFAPASQSAS